MLKKKALVALLLPISLITMGCYLLESQKPTRVPRDVWITRWLYNPSCLPPCWEMITPGVTTITKTVNILNNLAGVSNIVVTSGMSTGMVINWDFNQSGGSGGAISDEHGYVDVINLGAADDQLLTVGEVISTYGPPSHVLRGSRHLNESGLYIIYMDRGMFLYTQLPVDDGKVKVSPKTSVLELDFIQPGEESFLSTIHTLYDIVEWQGYTAYSVR